MADAQIRAVITAEDRASEVVNNVGKSVDNTAFSFGKLAGAVAAGQLAFNVADEIFNKISGVLGDIITKGETYQQATSNLQISLNNNADLLDKNIRGLVGQADALSKVTRFSDEQYVASESLLAIHKLNQQQIIDLVPHLADMAEGIATATGEMPDLASATLLISKAIGENDISGFSGTLRRAGVFLSDYQQNIIKNGDVSQKLGVITDVLSSHFKGLSTADTAAIKMGILNNQIDNAEQSIGLALLPTISILADRLAKFVESDKFQAWLQTATDWVQKNLPIALNWVINTGIPGLENAFRTLKPIIVDIANVISVMFEPLRVGISLVHDLERALDGLKSHHVDAGAIFGDLGKLVLPGPVQTLAHQLHVPGFATGVQDFQGGLAYVHQGEVLTNLAPGTNVIPKDKVNFQSPAPNINITIQSAAFMGSQIEARKFAQEIVNHINDVAGKKNMTGSQLLGGA